nr:hypothetical protein [Mycoplasmopsis bovis]
MRKKWINSVIFASKQFTNDFNYFLDEIEINVNKLNLSWNWHNKFEATDKWANLNAI